MHAIRAAGLAACLVTGGALSAAATSYSAINFNDWSSVTLFGPSGGQVVAPIPIGGNPLATLSVSTLTNATTYTGHVSGGLSYDFSEGAIESIDVSLQYNPVQAFGDGHGVLSLLIEQGGSYYGAGLGSTGAAPGWGTLAFNALEESDFLLFDGLSTGVPGGPDFSAGAASMTFGFLTFDSGGFASTVFYDNFAVTVTTAPIPLPAGLPLLVSAMGVLALRRCRRRRSAP